MPARDSSLNKPLLRELQQTVGQRNVLYAPEELLAYECDACVLIQRQPDCVVLPGSTEEVAQVVRICNRYHVPFVARGGGTGLSGGALAAEGGVLIALSRMNRILEIDGDNRTALVETGTVNAWLNREAAVYNLFYAPDPSSQAASTLGGNIAENAGGVHCIKYGVTADHILGLEVVTTDGEIAWLGGPHGQYRQTNWLGMFIGSEGTLGIATRAQVRLTPLPQAVKVFLVAFETLSDAGDAVSGIVKSGIVPAALEFMDDVTIGAVNAAFDMGFPEDSEAILLIELDGPAERLAIEEDRLRATLLPFRMQQFRTAETADERLSLWKARKLAVAAYGRILPAFYLHDCVIPRSKLTLLLRQIQAIGRKHQVIIGNVFHAGDGNLHPNILLDPRNEDMVRRALLAGEEILAACLAVGGVLSGEHGIGLEKAEFMAKVFTEAELAVMHRLKQALDPKGLANPGKVFPSRSGCGESRKGLPHLLQATGTENRTGR